MPNNNVIRNRLIYIALSIATIAVGLAVRRFGATLPPFVAAYAPDALWALMVFWVIGLVWTRATTAQVAVAALTFAYLIEISQLFHPAWLDAIRHTRLGGLVLGFGFLWSDIACYTVGVAVGVGVEWLWRLPPPLRETKVP
ncbi:MAG: DUF2809 domain-containing protein [Akkermansiaceae bacterium]|nr:DUF2809 domain-containing protein [Armatimonadota bacterium]